MDPLDYRHAINSPVTLFKDKKFIKLGKYYYGSLDIDSEEKLNTIPPKSLYIARPEEIDSSTNIYAPDDGRIIYKVYATN